jgi:hypothetical protein
VAETGHGIAQRQRARKIRERSQPRKRRSVVRQVRDRSLAYRERVPLAVLVHELDLHARHVDARRAFALAALARDAKIERGFHRLLAFAAELARERKPKRIGAPARSVHLVPGRAIRRAHRAGVELAAVAVVVAHLDGLVVSAPVRPVEDGSGDARRIAGPEAKERRVVHLRRRDDLARIEQAFRVEPGFDFAETRSQPRAERTERSIPSAPVRRRARPSTRLCIA